MAGRVEGRPKKGQAEKDVDGPVNPSQRLKPWHTTGLDRAREEIRHDAPLLLLVEPRDQGKAQ